MAEGLVHGFPRAYGNNSITFHRDGTKNVLENVECNLGCVITITFLSKALLIAWKKPITFYPTQWGSADLERSMHCLPVPAGLQQQVKHKSTQQSALIHHSIL